MLTGCVSSAPRGALDDWRRETLRTCTATLGKILPSIGDGEYGARYFTRLHEMAVLAAELDHARGE